MCYREVATTVERCQQLIDGYFLEGVDGEHLLVVRSDNLEIFHYIVGRMTRMRQKELKELGRVLQEELNAKY